MKGSPKRLRDAIEFLLADAPRPGIAPTFTAEQVCQIIALAYEPPPAHGSHWTRAALGEEAVKRGIVEQISCTTIGRFWTQGQIKPPLSRYWLNLFVGLILANHWSRDTPCVFSVWCTRLWHIGKTASHAKITLEYAATPNIF